MDLLQDPRVWVAVAIVVVFGLLQLLISRKSESTEKAPDQEQKDAKKQSQSQKQAPRRRPISEKAPSGPRHPLEVNTLKHGDAVTGLCFSHDGAALATACGDGVVRVYTLDDVTAKSIKFRRINTGPGVHPVGVAFGLSATEVAVSGTSPFGSCMRFYGPATGRALEEARKEGKQAPMEVKWEQRPAHGGKAIISISSAVSTQGPGDGTAVIATSSEATDVVVWGAADGKVVGEVDSNQLRNTMAALSPDGRFLAIAAFTADVKIWELVYGRDGAIQNVTRIMQLKGHKSAVTWLAFTWDSKGMVTASKDGTIKIWNIDVRYHLDEDPKCRHTFPILPLPSTATSDAAAATAAAAAAAPAGKKGKKSAGPTLPLLDRIAVSPDGRLLAVTVGAALLWYELEGGSIVTADEQAHTDAITWMAWSPKPVPIAGESKPMHLLATASADKKVKLWKAPGH
ncbi:hypothetical protein CLOP_g9588 [Closterium sp. NIES-67]|nr:hypothetical protein CLOP_g9588 [Closterium sp. NIES-67]